MLLQIRDGPGPGGAHVQVPQVHVCAATTRRRGAAWQDARLWYVHVVADIGMLSVCL